MLLDQEMIIIQQTLLMENRRRLVYRLRQQARLGDYTPPDVVFDIEEARTTINEIKAILRASGVDVADDPIDDPSTQPSFATPRTKQEQRNRSRMLTKVRDFWIKGVLKLSLHEESLIALGMQMQPDAVVQPWDVIIQQPNRPACSLPPSTPIAAVFDDTGGELLILGAPGSGKTTMLLELARYLLARADSDETHPIPVVFNLSSWAEQRRPLADWLVDELNARYDIPCKVGQTWVRTDQLLLLLDGLDEVRQEYRIACIETINTFHREHSLVNLVVCSRTADYSALRARLKLAGAILLQPLSAQQIDAYLTSAGEGLSTLRTLLTHDTALRELAKSPLMLNIMTLTYVGTNEFPSVSVNAYCKRCKDMRPATARFCSNCGATLQLTPEEWRTNLFAAYVSRMFARRGLDARYSPQQVTCWLTWLACGMTQHDQSIFFIERLQPDWLPTHAARRQYTIVDRLGGGLAVGIVRWLFGLIFTAGTGVPTMIFGAMLGGLFGGESNTPAFSRRGLGRLAYSTILGWLIGSVLYGLPSLLYLALLMRSRLGSAPDLELRDWLVVGLLAAAATGLPGAVAGALAGGPGVYPRQIAIVETLRWSWAKAGRSMLAGLLLLFLPVLCVLLGGSLFGLILGLTVMLYGGLIISLIGGLAGGEVEAKTRPNQGIWWSARNAIIIGVICGLGMGLLGGLVNGLAIGSASGTSTGVSAGLGTAVDMGLDYVIIGALAYGGYACLSHVALRYVLWRNGAIPWHYKRFLDYATGRIFLRKVGGGYIFIHRLLMEYFASLNITLPSNNKPMQTSNRSVKQ